MNRRNDNLFGYAGKIIEVDLTSGKIKSSKLDLDLLREYIGGAGLAAKIIWDETDKNTDPLSPANPLIFMTGPLTATAVPSSGRHIVAALSPLTNIWGEAHSGGSFAWNLKRAGFDGIIVRGRAKSPVFLFINNQKIEIRDARFLWGRDTFEADELIKKKYGRDICVASIGPAGENLVRFAAILNDGRLAHVAARCGLGAVMGSKNLKAVAVRGSGKLRIYDEKKIANGIKRFFVRTAGDDEWKKIRSRLVERMWRFRRPPRENFLKREWEFKKTLDWLIKTSTHKLHPCIGCPTGCFDSLMSGQRKRPGWQGFISLGPLCDVRNMRVIRRACDLCNQLGLDMISTGNVIAFAMEVSQKGVSGNSRFRGLTWGDGRLLLRLINQIVFDEKWRVILGQGVKKAADIIGGRARESAMHSKGLEMSILDPRDFNTSALEYATSNIGASHMTAFIPLDPFVTGEIRKKSVMAKSIIDSQVDLVIRRQNLMCLFDSLVICKFLTSSAIRYGAPDVDIITLLNWFNAVTGFGFGFKEFGAAGARIFNLQRQINVRRGITKNDDTLPRRLLSFSRRGGKTKISNLELMLNDYYKKRWER